MPLTLSFSAGSFESETLVGVNNGHNVLQLNLNQISKAESQHPERLMKQVEDIGKKLVKALVVIHTGDKQNKTLPVGQISPFSAAGSL